MSVRLTAASSQSLFGSSPVDMNLSYGIGGWIYWKTAALDTIVAIGNGANDFDFLVIDATGLLAVVAYTGGVNTLIAGGAITVALNTWTHVALERTGDTLRAYVNGVLDPTGTAAVAGRGAATGIQFGAFNFGNFDGRLFGWKAAQMVPGAAGWLNEMMTILPKGLGSGTVYWPWLVAGDYTDYSGSGFGMSAAGSPTTEDNPAISFGSASMLHPSRPPARVALTGTAASGMTESDAVAGGKTIVLTLSNSTFVPAA